MTTANPASQQAPAPGSRPLLEAMLNATEFHREHEKFYSVAATRAGSRTAAPLPHASRPRRPVELGDTLDT